MSVPANIAEGNAKRSSKEKNRFFEIAYASLEEVHVEALLAKDLHYITQSEFERINTKIHQISYLLTKIRSALWQKLQQNP